MLYLSNFVPKASYSTVLGHTWSLAVEEHFYLIWPILFVSFFRNHRKALLVGLALFVPFSLAARFYAISFEGVAKGFFVDRWTIVAGSSIATGCLLALLLTTGDRKNWAAVIKSNLNLLLGGVLFCHSLVWGDVPYGLGAVIRGIGIAQIVGWIYLNQGSGIVALLEFRPIRYVGVISYGLYMWQGFFLATGPWRAPGQNWPVGPAEGLILLLVMAPMSFHGFEKPFLTLKKRFYAAHIPVI